MQNEVPWHKIIIISIISNKLIFISYWFECRKIFMPFIHTKIFTGKIHEAEKSYDELHFHILSKFWLLVHPAEIT